LYLVRNSHGKIPERAPFTLETAEKAGRGRADHFGPLPPLPWPLRPVRIRLSFFYKLL